MSYLITFLLGVAGSLSATALWIYGRKKRKGYHLQRVEDLEYEKERIEAISRRPTELYRDSFRNLFYLIFIIALANMIGLAQSVISEPSHDWRRAFIEGGLWLVVSFLSIRYKNRIDSTYSKAESLAELDEKIAKIKGKVTEN